MSINDRNVPRENTPTQQNQNPNPRRNNPQIRQRDKRGPDQQIRPQFEENYAEEGREVIEEVEKNQINSMGTNEDDSIFLTQEKEELFLLTQMKLESEESNDYKHCYENSILEFHIQYNLKSMKKMITPTEKI